MYHCIICCDHVQIHFTIRNIPRKPMNITGTPSEAPNSQQPAGSVALPYSPRQLCFEHTRGTGWRSCIWTWVYFPYTQIYLLYNQQLSRYWTPCYISCRNYRLAEKLQAFEEGTCCM